MADSVALLQQLGFSDYEARAYTALLQRNPLNGYELAKVSGLPRANIYAVLQKLEDRNAVVRMDTPIGTRYAPVSPQELTRRIGDRFADILRTAQTTLNTLATPSEYAYVWNVRDYPALLEHARALTDLAQKQVLVAITPAEAATLAGHFTQAAARDVAVTTLCMAACPDVCGGCQGQVYRYRVAPDQPGRWMLLVIDGGEVLASEIDANTETQAIRTQQPLLVDLVSWYIRHSIALAAVLGDLGEHLDALLAPQTRAILHAIGPGAPGGGWLETMRALLGQRPGR